MDTYLKMYTALICVKFHFNYQRIMFSQLTLKLLRNINTTLLPLLVVIKIQTEGNNTESNPKLFVSLKYIYFNRMKATARNTIIQWWYGIYITLSLPDKVFSLY